LSVPLPAELRERLVAEAERRQLKLATTARLLLDERVRELEERAEVSEADAWQRAQAWATWEKIKSGDLREVSAEQLRERLRAQRK
jgi:hypothetical protein